MAQSSHAQLTIVSNPQATALYAGRTASFTVQATDNQSFTYRWMAGPTNGSGPYTNLNNTSNISGVTTSNLVITAITTNNAADYVVVLTDSTGSSTSSVATLTVAPAPTDVYGQQVVADVPAAYWRMNEPASTGKFYDWMGGNTGILAPATQVTQGNAGVSSHTANASMYFPGVNNTNGGGFAPYNYALESCSNVSLEAWFMPTGTVSGQTGEWWVSIQQRKNTLPYEGPTIGCSYTNTSGPLTHVDAQWGENSSATYQNDVTTELPNWNTWWHVVGTYNGTNEMMYLNGALISSGSAPYGPVTNGTCPMTFGVLWAVSGGPPNYAAYCCEGYECDVAFYQYALTAYQITNHYSLAINGAAVPLPAFTSQPNSASVIAGQTATFSVGASFAFPLTYQWQVESNGLYVNLANGGNISGATSDALVVTSATLANATNYRVLISYPGLTSLTSSVVALAVVGSPPTITNQPLSTNVNAGQTATFAVGVSFAYPLTYQWQVQSNGLYVNLANGGNISGATNASLVISNVTAANAAVYQVVISYPGLSSQTSSRAALSVTALPPPAIPFNYSVSAGVVKLSWTNSQFVLEQATNLAGPWVTNTSASGVPISPTNAQMFYRLLAPYTAAITVPAPVIIQEPLLLNLYAGNTASFSVQVSFLLSQTNLSYQWMAGTIGSGVYTNLTNAGNISGVTTTNLVITNISLANAADYVLVVSYPGNSITSTVATLSVQPAPAQMLLNASLNGPFSGGVVNNWYLNPWSGASMSGSSATDNTFGACQEIVVNGIQSTNSGALFYQGETDGAFFLQPFTCTNGRVYTGSIWMRASADSPVQLVMREVDSGYVPGASHILTIGTNWQEIEMTGGWQADTNCQFGVYFLTNGTFWLADASLEDVTLDYQQAPLVNTSTTIPATLFGMHVNGLNFNNWPPLQQGVMRLWDTGTRWCDLQPTTNGPFTWTRFDTWTNFILGNNPNCQIIYTMGQTPTWAAAWTNTQTTPINPPGCTAPASNMLMWSNYVWQVATRYKGIIHYYELWNESDGKGFWSGTPAQMVTLATNAISVLHSVDPTIQVMGPNITYAGLTFLEEYIQAGGPPPNIMTFHDYPKGGMPENSFPVVAGVRDVLSRYPAFSSLPLWCTEGAPQIGANNQQDMGITARCYLLWWAQNIPNWNWYTWDISVGGVQNVPLSINPPSEVPAPGGIAYSNLVNWLVGAQMTGKSVDTNGTWMLELQQPGTPTSHILWNPYGTTNYSIPASWNVYQQVDLSNNITSLAGVTNVSVGVEPVLLQSQQ